MSTVHFVIETEEDIKWSDCITLSHIPALQWSLYTLSLHLMYYCSTWKDKRGREETETEGRDLDYHFNMLVSSQSVHIDLECVSVCALVLMFLCVDWKNCTRMQTQFAICSNRVSSSYSKKPIPAQKKDDRVY